MMVVACLSSTAGCAAYGQSVNAISTRESPELARFDPFAAINRWFDRRTKRGSMLWINADLKRRALD